MQVTELKDVTGRMNHRNAETQRSSGGKLNRRYRRNGGNDSMYQVFLGDSSLIKVPHPTQQVSDGGGPADSIP